MTANGFFRAMKEEKSKKKRKMKACSGSERPRRETNSERVGSTAIGMANTGFFVAAAIEFRVNVDIAQISSNRSSWRAQTAG